LKLAKFELIKPDRLLTEEETYSHCYGKFIAEPLERGFGITLGNAMRRVLLSSLKGAAITSVKIEGVLHEFSTIPGVVEDVTQIVLNLKQIRFRSYTDEPVVLTLEAEGEGEVTAADIKPHSLVEVVNPDQHIATLGEEGRLKMEMEVRTGRGYIPYDLIKEQEPPPGVILIDAIFSPVRKVNFRVEETRVEQMTNYDRLILEVWTDGSITPREAIAEAADILTDYLRMFIDFEIVFKEREEIPQVPSEADKLKELLNKSISSLGLPSRITNILAGEKITTIGDLVTKTEEDLLGYKNLGTKSLEEIKNALNSIGLTLGIKIDEEGNVIFPSAEEGEKDEAQEGSQEAEQDVEPQEGASG